MYKQKKSMSNTTTIIQEETIAVATTVATYIGTVSSVLALIAVVYSAYNSLNKTRKSVAKITGKRKRRPKY